MKLLIVSDIHGSTANVQKASELFRSSDVTVIAGDLSKSGKHSLSQEVMSLIESYTDRIIAVPGNWDAAPVHDHLLERGYSVHGRGRVVDRIGFFGAGGSTRTPMHTATEYSEDELRSLMQKGYDDIEDCTIKILVTHVPPRNVCDRTLLGLRGGSRAVRDFLEKHDIDLCISGHIHESSGVVRFRDNCQVVNAGALKKGRYAMAELGDSVQIALGRLPR